MKLLFGFLLMAALVSVSSLPMEKKNIKNSPSQNVLKTVETLKVNVNNDYNVFLKKHNMTKINENLKYLFDRFVKAKDEYNDAHSKATLHKNDFTSQKEIFEKDKQLISHLYEYIKIYVDKDNNYLKQHCICNSTVI